jgi:hypothetical protein
MYLLHKTTEKYNKSIQLNHGVDENIQILTLYNTDIKAEVQLEDYYRIINTYFTSSANFSVLQIRSMTTTSEQEYFMEVRDRDCNNIKNYEIGKSTIQLFNHKFTILRSTSKSLDNKNEKQLYNTLYWVVKWEDNCELLLVLDVDTSDKDRRNKIQPTKEHTFSYSYNNVTGTLTWVDKTGKRHSLTEQDLEKIFGEVENLN